MSRLTACTFTATACAAWLAFASFAHAADGNVLINQDSTSSSFGLGCRSTGFPIVICQPGSYRLTSNITVPTVNTTAISIQADNVTLDLNGFSLIGPRVCTGFPLTNVCTPGGTGSGVFAEGRRNIAVFNGSIRGMGNYGVFLRSGRIEHINADSNGTGIAIAFGLVSGNTAASNAAFGFLVLGSAVVRGNHATANTQAGFQIQCPSTFVDNTSIHNPGPYFDGPGCAVANNAGQ